VLLYPVQQRSRKISTVFSSAERERFRNLLELAKSSKFDGERANAMAAAKRLAAKHGLTLEEAARFQDHSSQGGVHDVSFDTQVADEKTRWEEAVEKARQRGLDKRKKSRAEPDRPKRFNRSRRDPTAHATVLLKETRLPIQEIADITGLDIYAVVGMKLKMRRAA
jgi:Zn-dependent oligopeptidase